jgi:hypothetical protein
MRAKFPPILSMLCCGHCHLLLPPPHLKNKKIKINSIHHSFTAPRVVIFKFFYISQVLQDSFPTWYFKYEKRGSITFFIADDNPGFCFIVFIGKKSLLQELKAEMQLEKKALEEEETSEDDESQRSSVQSGSQQDFPSKVHTGLDSKSWRI